MWVGYHLKGSLPRSTISIIIAFVKQLVAWFPVSQCLLEGGHPLESREKTGRLLHSHARTLAKIGRGLEDSWKRYKFFPPTWDSIRLVGQKRGLTGTTPSLLHELVFGTLRFRSTNRTLPDIDSCSYSCQSSVIISHSTPAHFYSTCMYDQSI